MSLAGLPATAVSCFCVCGVDEGYLEILKVLLGVFTAGLVALPPIDIAWCTNTHAFCQAKSAFCHVCWWEVQFP